MTAAARAVLDAAMSEAGFQQAVIDLARQLQWRVVHFRPARTEHGWATPVAADGAGWPDLVLCRERLIFAELKAEKGRLTPEQQRWLDALEHAGAETYVFRPSDWDAVVATLTARSTP